MPPDVRSEEGAADSGRRRRRTWVFDVDGCLIDAITGGTLRPLVHELLDSLQASGTEVVLWSAGGGQYAARRARQLGIDHRVVACYSKAERDAAGAWVVDDVCARHDARLFVDDCPDELPRHVAVAGVRPYLAGSPHDRGLADLLRLAQVT